MITAINFKEDILEIYGEVIEAEVGDAEITNVEFNFKADEESPEVLITVAPNEDEVHTIAIYADGTVTTSEAYPF